MLRFKVCVFELSYICLGQHLEPCLVQSGTPFQLRGSPKYDELQSLFGLVLYGLTSRWGLCLNKYDLPDRALGDLSGQANVQKSTNPENMEFRFYPMLFFCESVGESIRKHSPDPIRLAGCLENAKQT